MAVKGNLPLNGPSKQQSQKRDESKKGTVSAENKRKQHKNKHKSQDASKIFKGLQTLYS